MFPDAARNPHTLCSFLVHNKSAPYDSVWNVKVKTLLNYFVVSENRIENAQENLLII